MIETNLERIASALEIIAHELTCGRRIDVANAEAAGTPADMVVPPAPAPEPKPAPKKAKKAVAPVEEAPAPAPTPAPAPAPVAAMPDQKEVEAASYARMMEVTTLFVNINKGKSPDGMTTAKALLAELFSSTKVTALNHEQRLTWIAELEKRMVS